MIRLVGYPAPIIWVVVLFQLQCESNRHDKQIFMNLDVDSRFSERARGDGDKEKLSEVTWGRNVKRNQGPTSRDERV